MSFKIGFIILSTIVAPLWAVPKLGDLASNVQSNFSSIVILISSAAYVLGLSLIVSGLIKLKHHRENPAQNPLGIPLTMLAVGSILIYLQSFVPILGGTFFQDMTSVGVAGSSSLG